MALRKQQAPQCVYDLADRLDRVLAACEDLVNSSQNNAATLGRLELTAISHTLKARRSLQELWVDDDALSDQVALFLAGTGGFTDSRAGVSDSARAAEPLGTHERLSVTEDYLIGGRTPVGILADLASAMLNLLEARYGALWHNDRNHLPYHRFGHQHGPFDRAAARGRTRASRAINSQKVSKHNPHPLAPRVRATTRRRCPHRRPPAQWGGSSITTSSNDGERTILKNLADNPATMADEQFSGI